MLQAHRLGLGQSAADAPEVRLFCLWRRGLWGGDVLGLPWRVGGALLAMDREYEATRRGVRADG